MSNKRQISTGYRNIITAGKKTKNPFKGEGMV